MSTTTVTVNSPPTTVAQKPKQKTAQKKVRLAFRFPDGMDIADYPGFETWSNTAWAWQFLRRNKSFQKRCNHIRNMRNPLGIAMLQKATAHAFGLTRFKDFIEEFEDGITPNPQFASSAISAWACLDYDQDDSDTLPSMLRPGQALLRFDLDAMGVTHKSLLAQVDAAKKTLEELLQQRLQVTNNTPKNPKPKAPFIEVLRAYDADTFKRTKNGKYLTYLAIANAILPQMPPPIDPVTDINSRVARGREYVDTLYHDLAASKNK